MSDIKGVFKSGWHPKGKDGGKESWRGDFKGINQVAGWMGKSKQPGSGADEPSSHVSRPLATLKDPSLFGPPPRNVNYHGGAALPHEITPQTGGIGAPLSQNQIESARVAHNHVYELEAEEPAKPAPPPLPYRADRTGLQTNNLPPPPARRDVVGAEGHQPARPTPNLPPRLPSRQNTSPSPIASPPPYEAAAQSRSPVPTPTLNQSAMNRLGNAGVSVPSLGIGKTTSSTDKNPWKNEQSQSTSNSVSELQSRFKRFNAGGTANTPTPDTQQSTSPTAQAQPPAMPSWKQTQSTFRTAQNFQKDPTSVSLADAQQAATTAQSAHANATAFQARHADKFDTAERKATALNKRYNVTGRLNRFLEDANDEHDKTTQQHQQQQPNQQNAPLSAQPSSPQNQVQASETLTASIARKPPPPPPPKKPGNLQAPPPVPLGTKPR